MSVQASSLDHLEREMRGEFQDETRDICNALDLLLNNVENGRVNLVDALQTLRRSFLNLEMRAQVMDNHNIAILSHRAAEFLSDINAVSTKEVPEVQAFIDLIRRVLDGELPASGSAEMVRQTPFRHIVDFDVNDAIKQSNVESMLVIPDNATGRFIERELAACGYRVSNARTFFRGLELAVRTKPDFIIAAAMLDDLSGVELARALSAITATAQIPFALLTSFALGHPSLAGMPAGAAIMRKGPDFGEDFAAMLAKFKII